MGENFVLIAITYLIVKHFVCDFPFRMQTPWMFLNKGTYGHPGGLTHAYIQALASAPLFFWAANHTFWYSSTKWHGMTPLGLAGALLVSEFVIHYHVDWFKMWYNKRKNWHTKTPQFWTFLGADQLVHYLTYIAMLWLWIQ